MNCDLMINFEFFDITTLECIMGSAWNLVCVGQVAHVSPTPWVTSQEADITCWARLRRGCWCNNSTNSHPSLDALNRRVLRTCLVPQCSYSPHRPRHQRRLANCDWMPASNTSGQPSNPCRHPTCWSSSHCNHDASGTPWHGAWKSVPLSAHPSFECKRMAPKIETPIFTRPKTSRHFIWQQQLTCGALGGSPMECGVGGQPHKTPHFHSRHQHPPPPEKASWFPMAEASWL